MEYTKNFPRQKLSYKAKSKKWRESVMDWADGKSYLHNQYTRQTFKRKKINLDLYNGKLDMNDLKRILNPLDVKTGEVPPEIQHYPIVSPIIDVLVGEESKRRFDFKILVSNPNAISEKENQKKEEVLNKIMPEIQDSEQKDPETYQKYLEELQYFIKYDWQDMREIRANYLVNHYMKELNIQDKFNRGFKNACTMAEEAYAVYPVQGEPHVEVLNPLKLHVLRNGYSTRMEDADVIIYDDMWSPGRIIDTYYDQLKAKDIDYLETYPGDSSEDEMYNYDETKGFILKEDEASQLDGIEGLMATSGATFSDYTDNYGNVRVLRCWWKSKRKILKVKKYDPETGEPDFTFYPETYVPNEAMGEESETFWINEAWQGTKIGKNIYVDMKPMQVQFSRMSNPSRCHFGIIGEIFSTNESKAISIMDRAKSYQYMYDIVHDRLAQLLATNYGKIAEIDIAKIPSGWDPKLWLYYANKFKIGFVDSFKEGNKGAATGKLAGGFNTIGGRTIDLDQGNAIQYHINMLQWIEKQIGVVTGVTQQRVGNVHQSETVGGVERAVAHSSNVTGELFMRHDNVKKRVLETLIEVSKICLKGNKKKLQYITDDGSQAIFDIDGDEFSEIDYGIVVDNSSSNIELSQKLDQLAHAALQNQTLSFGSIMSIYTENSLSSVRRRIEIEERERLKQQQESAQREQEAAERELQERVRQFQEMQQWEKEKFYTEQENKIYIEELKANVATDKPDLEEEKFEHDKERDVNKEKLDEKYYDLAKKKTEEELKIKNKELIKKLKEKTKK